MKVLATYPGKYGDILWSLAAIRAYQASTGDEVTFACMPKYQAILPLIAVQPYIAFAYALDGWEEESNTVLCAQPAVPQAKVTGFDKVYHLGFRVIPGWPVLSGILGRQYIDHSASVMRVYLRNPLPFLDVGCQEVGGISVAFTDMHPKTKRFVLSRLLNEFGPAVTVVNTLPFLDAARAIQISRIFVGCRSSNYVVAHGLNKRVIAFEPDEARRAEQCGCRFGNELLTDDPETVLAECRRLL